MIRRATPADVPAILRLIHDLAEYEKAAHEVRASEEQLRAALFAAEPAVFAHVAEEEGADGEREVVGFALWFLSFSTWRGTHGVYLEDLYVRPDRRGGGHGRALLAELARICVERGYHRLEWSVLDWNEPAIGFYRALGAVPMDEWTVFRLTDEPLRALAGRAS
ncbi:GNAT family N-acetyltransferase [Nonomuraea roseoviolacea subsp. roseoviolacea]|uniref:GNAT superfamily N-acetyltransferase n=1 Tax=Nonomuraea roseoviolacea subsp. carminata TaxID=160689 RepID=A0ABT1K8N2_9ACTN|nr:GNAT family N-acetyltransferase [Nonomuraea roseoviolacea]MCP2349761.1 GNAT superfamily N-acetyltransferase [Nonomuraea roseoviolacea subsp. carminata]